MAFLIKKYLNHKWLNKVQFSSFVITFKVHQKY